MARMIRTSCRWCGACSMLCVIRQKMRTSDALMSRGGDHTSQVQRRRTNLHSPRYMALQHGVLDVFLGAGHGSIHLKIEKTAEAHHQTLLTPAPDLHGGPLPAYPLWNTRVLGVRIKQARCTCFATQMNPKAVWPRRLRNMQVSLC